MCSPLPLTFYYRWDTLIASSVTDARSAPSLLAGQPLRRPRCHHEVMKPVLENGPLFLAECHTSAVELYRTLSDTPFEESIKTPFESDAGRWQLAEGVIDHETHHRGQLHTYLRLLKCRRENASTHILSTCTFSERGWSWKNQPSVSVRQLVNVDRKKSVRGRSRCRGGAKLSWKLKRLQTLWFDDVDKTAITPREKRAEMSSVLRPVRKRKKSRTLGPVDVIRREDYGELELDAKVELIRSLVPLGLMHVEEMLDDEVTALAGDRYARKDASIGGRRHGSNPGTVGLAGQRVPIRVPRIRRVAGGEIPLRSYAALHDEGVESVPPVVESQRQR